MKEKIVLKSANPEEYGDLVIECRVIENAKIGEYLESIPEEEKIVAYKTGRVLARKGELGEKVFTVLKTVVDGKEYILSEEEGTVKERPMEKNGQTEMALDYVVTNVSSTSNEEYIVKAEKIASTYEYVGPFGQEGLILTPAYDPRVLTRVSENVIIMTAWGSKAVCLAGGYIVTYNASENDYNVLEAGAFESTYEVLPIDSKKLKRK